MGTSVARLYEQFQPELYELHLVPDRENMTFEGSVSIRGKKTGRPSQRITLHQKDLKIAAASIIKHDKNGPVKLAVTRINNQDSLNEVRIHTEEKIFPGDYSVILEFSGHITKPMNGMYPCFFKHEGKDKILIATQFESHHAREAFPCIDEPEAKAEFELTLTTPTGETVISNTPAASEEAVAGNKTLTRFGRTPRMSTYLLAFVFGELGYKEAATKDKVLIRAYATPDNVALTEHALDSAVRCLKFFTDYFDRPYPLQKLDMVALPDFSSGAMENWGLVTYRETAMLADPSHSSIETKQLVTRVVCHELSHQWFGNLVTMKWWDDLWLNESFANLMEYVAMDALYPEWRVWEHFVSQEMVSAKRRDALLDVQPVHMDVHHPDEISTLFDPSIVYAKGGSVLYMLKNYLGEEAFRKGLAAYFKQHAYGNTQADDLWEALGAASGKDLKAFMHKWLTSPGYPLVSVNWQPASDSIQLSQRRFLSDPEASMSDTDPWQVPLALNTGPSDLFTRQEATIKTKPDKALLLNHDGASYFLPYYANAEHRVAIVHDLKANKVSDIDRFLLLDNYVLLQRGGISDITELMDLLEAYEGETSETVWGAMTMSIAEARKLIEYDDEQDDYLDAVVRKLVAPLADKLGWDDRAEDDAQTLRLRGLAVSLAVGAKYQPMIDEGLQRFAGFKLPSDLTPSTRGIVYYCGARFGSASDFTKLIELYKTIQNADEKEEIAGGITAAKAPESYAQSLDLLKSDVIRRQDLMHWYAWLLRNRYSREAAWQWLTANWDWLEKEFSSDKSYGYFPRFGGGVFSKPEELKKFQDFFTPKKSAIALNRDITLAEQEIKSRIAWRIRNEAAIKTWLREHH